MQLLGVIKTKCSSTAWRTHECKYLENIIFNLPFVADRYQETLEACALVNDLKILEDGDESEIGERGVRVMVLFLMDKFWFNVFKVNLSGGQKARGLQALSSNGTGVY